MSEITPALTAEEWAENKYVRNGKTLHLTHGGTPLWLTATDDVMLAWDEDLAPLVALANAALPDDDPRKITRADMLWLYGLAAVLRMGVMQLDADQCEQFADKLAALLPPENDAQP